MIFFKSIKLAIFHANKKAGSIQFDKRKKKKVSPPISSAALKRAIATLVGVPVIKLDIKQIEKKI